jgi:hypothetical protein
MLRAFTTAHRQHDNTNAKAEAKKWMEGTKPQRGGRPLIPKPPDRCAIITGTMQQSNMEEKETNLLVHTFKYIRVHPLTKREYE